FGLAAGVAVQALVGSVVETWYTARQQATTAAAKDFDAEVRRAEGARRRQALLEPIVARLRVPVDLSPPTASPSGSRPTELPPWWVTAVRRGVPVLSGAAVVTALGPIGIPLGTLIASWGVAAVAVTVGPLAERYRLRQELAADVDRADLLAREVDVRDAALEVALAEALHALLDRLDRIFEQRPVDHDPPSRPAPVPDSAAPGRKEYLVKGAFEGGHHVVRQTAGAVDQAATDPMGKLVAQLDPIIHGLSRLIAGVVTAGYVERAWREREVATSAERSRYDQALDQAELHLRKWEVAQELLALARRQADEAEWLVAEQQALLRSVAHRAARIAREPVPPADPGALTPRPPGGRPPGRPSRRAFAVRAGVPAVVAVAVAATLGVPEGVFWAVAASAAVEPGGAVGQWWKRKAELAAADAKREAERGPGARRAAAEIEAVHRFASDLVRRELDARTEQVRRAARVRRLVDHLRRPRQSVFTGWIRPDRPEAVLRAVAEAFRRLATDPGPWESLPARLAALREIEVLAHRVRRFTEHAEATGRSAPLAQARTDLGRALDAYHDLLRESGLPAQFP
ncbi:hypothetical protein ALI22I_26800, partial [Saccharothrix sp. ALI-22-I]